MRFDILCRVTTSGTYGKSNACLTRLSFYLDAQSDRLPVNSGTVRQRSIVHFNTACIYCSIYIVSYDIKCNEPRILVHTVFSSIGQDSLGER